MLPAHKNQKVFVEITNLEHGGSGWELGICMWSPAKDRGGHAAWRLMDEIQRGDVILHLVDIEDSYHWYAVSVADSELIKTNISPPIPGKWIGFSSYQRVNLSNFIRLKDPFLMEDFFSRYNLELRENLQKNKRGQFYVEYGKGKELRMAQRYIAKCPNELYGLFNHLSGDIGFSPIFGFDENIPTLHEPQNPDFSQPGRVETMISRIVRDTALSRSVKEENDWRCYICGKPIVLPNSSLYAEGHHLQPLGGNYQGPDVRENILIVCPSHHAEFDYGSIAINPDTGFIEHVDANNSFNNLRPAYYREDLGINFIRFHYHHRFRQTI